MRPWQVQVSMAKQPSKMDWQERSFVPFMKAMREKHKDWNDYQFAYIGVLHGISMGSAERAVTQIKDSCNAKNKASLEESFYK